MLNLIPELRSTYKMEIASRFLREMCLSLCLYTSCGIARVIIRRGVVTSDIIVIDVDLGKFAGERIPAAANLLLL